MGPVKGTWGGVYCAYQFYTDWSDAAKQISDWQTSGQVGVKFSLYDNNQWLNQETRNVETSAGYTRYQYRDRSKVYTYYLKKVESKESTTKVEASDSISNVKRWVQYVVAE